MSWKSTVNEFVGPYSLFEGSKTSFMRCYSILKHISGFICEYEDK